MAQFKKGETVEQVIKPITGQVAGYQVDQETGSVLIEVRWEDAGGTHSRYFKEDELKAVTN